jgi:hypothetical protein
MFAFQTAVGSTSGPLHPFMLRGMGNCLIFLNGHNKARFTGRLGKSIAEENKAKVQPTEDLR